MQLTKNFSFEEMECKCGTCNSHGKISPKLMAKLQQLRDQYGPISVNSGYRCKFWNAKVGGAPKSYHLKGEAADCKVLNAEDRHRFVMLAAQLGFTVIPYRTFVHVDVREDGPKLLIGG